MSLECSGKVFFTLRPSDLSTTLTYVLMENFYPCLRVGQLQKFIFEKKILAVKV